MEGLERKMGRKLLLGESKILSLFSCFNFLDRKTSAIKAAQDESADKKGPPACLPRYVLILSFVSLLLRSF